MNLRGKIVLITGASSGIGAAAARHFGALGATVLLVARSTAALEAVAADVRAAGGNARVFPLDLSAVDGIGSAAASIVAALGVPDILVNNAGMGRWLRIEETPPAEALAMTVVPYVGALALTGALVGGMIKRGRGQIINVTSPAAYTPFPGAVAYSVARATMRAFTNALHADLRGTGVRATLVVLGEVDSPYFAHNPGARSRLPAVGRLYPVLTVERAAAAILRAAQRRPRRLVAPALLRYTLWLWFLAPWLVQGVVTLTGHRRARQPRV